MSIPKALPNNNASGLADTHAANSRPEIELILKKEIFDQWCAHDESDDAFYELIISTAPLFESLIAQEADKLANKRIAEVLARLDKHNDGTMLGARGLFEALDIELEKLDKGDSHG